MSEEIKAPPVVDVVVELGVIRMRDAVKEGPGEPYRPRVCLWVDHGTGIILHFEMTEPLVEYLSLVVDSLRPVVERIGGLPRQIQLRDPQLATEFKTMIAPFGVEVVVRESLPMLDEAVASLMDFKKIGGKPQPGLLDVPGMTLDHAIAYAEAAKAFYQARPWQYLSDDDLIAIESPAGPMGTAFVQVLGAAGQVFGLGFVASRKVYENIQAGNGFPRGPIWSLIFGDIDSIRYDDSEAWESRGLPLAGPHAYSSFMCTGISKGETYPTPAQLVWAEGLLRALAGVTEDELDRARWEKTVETHGGVAIYKFSLPILLEQMAGKRGGDSVPSVPPSRVAMEPILRAIGKEAASRGEMTEADFQQFSRSLAGKKQVFTPTTDAEKAQAMCYEAYESRGRRRVQLARQALAIDPDCCDAMLILAELVGDVESAIPMYLRAMEAGARQLGAERFEQDAGHFWGIVETRPYMRARQLLAIALMHIEKFEEATEHFKEMLRLNPHDNQGNRYHLAQCLLHSNQLDALDKLLNHSQFKDDVFAEWVYTRALLEYRRKGDSPEARRRLDEAKKRNEFVVPLLTGKAEMPPFSPTSFSLGHEDEAVACVEQIDSGWRDTPGAIEWLKSTAKPTNRRAIQWQREREKKRKRR